MFCKQFAMTRSMWPPSCFIGVHNVMWVACAVLLCYFVQHEFLKSTVHAPYSYQQYLERVMEEKDSFQEIGDIMTRHAT